MADGRVDGSAKTAKGKSKAVTIPTSVKSAIESIAKGLGVAVTELWTIFVRQYVVRGISEAFTAVVLYGAAYYFAGTIGYFAFIPAVVGLGFTYGAIAYLGNPKYYALSDITHKIQEFKDSDDKKHSKDTIYL